MGFLPKLAPLPIPGPRPVPVLGPDGNLFRFFGDPVTSVRKLHAEHGDLVALTGGSPAAVCAFGPEHNRRVLTSSGVFQHNTEMPFALRDSALRRLNHNLVMMNGETHKRQRRMMMPAFQKAAIDAHRDDIAAIGERALRAFTPGSTLDVCKEMTTMTLRVAIKCFFGLDVGDGADELGRLGVAILDGITSPLVMMAPYSVPGLPFHSLNRAADRLEVLIQALIQRRRAKPDGRDVLSLMIQAHDDDGSQLTDLELLAQSFLLFIAGHETTAYTLTWTLLLLAQHPRVLADLLDELRGKLHGDAPTAAQVGELPLLDHVLKESMRLLPATPVLFIRVIREDAELGPYRLPKSAGVILSPIITHTLPEIYPEPRRFLPERWATIRPSAYEYLPFGTGPRMCLGAGFANLALRVLLPLVLQHGRLDFLPGASVSQKVRGITMGPKRGVPMRAARHDGSFPTPVRLGGNVRDLVDLPS
jgi:cytochrome P450